MKKIIALFLAALVVFSTASVALAAVEPEDANDEIITLVPEKEEATTRKAINDDGLVIPINFDQLKLSVIFKVIEKIFKFVFKLIAGDDGSIDDVDNEAETAIINAGDWLEQIFSEIDSKIDSNNATATTN